MSHTVYINTPHHIIYLAFSVRAVAPSALVVDDDTKDPLFELLFCERALCCRWLLDVVLLFPWPCSEVSLGEINDKMMQCTGRKVLSTRREVRSDEWWVIDDEWWAKMGQKKWSRVSRTSSIGSQGNYGVDRHYIDSTNKLYILLQTLPTCISNHCLLIHCHYPRDPRHVHWAHPRFHRYWTIV